MATLKDTCTQQEYRAFGLQGLMGRWGGKKLFPFSPSLLPAPGCGI